MAIQQALQPFVWGRGGRMMTPDEIAREREIAEALMAGGIDTSPVGHWLEGAARVAQTLSGKVREGRASRAESEGRAGASEAFSKLFGGSGGDVSGAPSAATTSAPAAPVSGDIRGGIIEAAAELGVDPVDLGTAISYETAGTFDPTKRGPTTKWGQHRGFIQFGEPQAQQYGVDWNNPVGSQLGAGGAVVKYLRDAGVQPGMGLLDIYSAINAGGVGLYDRSDEAVGGAPGTVRDKVEQQMAGHREKALALIGGQPQQSGQPVQVASLDPSAGVAEALTSAPAQDVAAGQPVSPGAIPMPAAGVGQVYGDIPFADSGPQAAVGGISAPVSPTTPAPEEEAVVAALTGSAVNPDTPMMGAGGAPVVPFERGLPFPDAPTGAMPQAAGAAPMGGGANMQGIMDVLGNPFATEGQKMVASALLKQQIEGPDRQQLINAGKGRVFDPNTGQWHTAPDMGTDAPTVQTFYDEESGQSYKAQWNPQSGSWERVGGTEAPSGMSLRTNPDGSVEFVQGSGAGQKLTEMQGKDIGFYTRGMDADERLSDLQGELTDFAQENARLLPLGIGNYLRTPEFRQAKQAADSFLTALLRKDTGAAITDQEFQIYGPMFLPVPGDDQGTIQQKQRARQVALLALRSGLGTAEAIAEANRIALGLPEEDLPLTSNPKNEPRVIDGYTIEEVD